MAFTEWEKVQSSNLDSISYDPIEFMLRIKFKSGAVYEYWDVPEAVWEGLKNAESKGKYFYSAIRNGPYGYKKV